MTREQNNMLIQYFIILDMHMSFSLAQIAGAIDLGSDSLGCL